MSTELATKPTTINEAALALFTPLETDLLALAEKYRDVAFDMSTPKGLKAAKEARLELRESGRFAIQRLRDKTKDQLNDGKKVVEAEAARLIAIVEPVETAVDEQIKVTEERLAKEKAEREKAEAEARAAREKAEAERRAQIEGYVTEIRDCLSRCVGQDSAYIGETLQWLHDNPVTEVDFGERTAEAQQLHATTVEKLTTMKTTVEQAEAQRLLIEQQQRELAEREASDKARRAIDDSLRAIRDLPFDLIDADSAALRAKLTELAAVDSYIFGERGDEASALLESVVAELRNLLAVAEQEEAEAAEAAKTAQAQEATPSPAQPAEVYVDPSHSADAMAYSIVAAVPAAGVTQIAPATSRFRNNVGGAPRANDGRPNDYQLIRTVAMFYRVPETRALEWIRGMDLQAVGEYLAAEFAA